MTCSAGRVVNNAFGSGMRLCLAIFDRYIGTFCLLSFPSTFRRTKKPLQPKVKIHIGSDAAGAARPLPVLGAYAFGDTEGSCLVVYGSLVKPGFEKMVSSDLTVVLVFKRPSVTFSTILTVLSDARRAVVHHKEGPTCAGSFGQGRLVSHEDADSHCSG